MRIALAAAAVLAAAASQACAQASAPTSDDGSLPPICADRPTKASNPCTVDAGHFQYESDVFNGTFQREGGLTTDTYLATSPTLKYGVSKTLDAEVSFTPYEVVRTRDKFGNGDTLGGFGDIFLRLKWNPLQSADGKFSAAISPYVKLPTARDGIGNGETEAGAFAPITYKLTDKLTAAIQPELDALADDTGGGRHLATAQLVNLTYNLPHDVSVAAELWGDWDFDPSGTVRQYSFDLAAAWLIHKYFQVDGGVNIGLNAATPGAQVYAGVSQKF